MPILLTLRAGSHGNERMIDVDDGKSNRAASYQRPQVDRDAEVVDGGESRIGRKAVRIGDLDVVRDDAGNVSRSDMQVGNGDAAPEGGCRLSLYQGYKPVPTPEYRRDDDHKG